MKKIGAIITLFISYFLAAKFIEIFSTGWTRFIRKVNSNRLVLRGISVLGLTFVKKKRGNVSAFRYERMDNGVIRKIPMPI